MGKFIVLEGLDGSGKGTQTELLCNRLESEGRRVRVIEFPDYASDGSMLVRMYLNGRLGADPADTNAYAASMFFAADRYVSYVTSWRDDWRDPDTVVLANRYTTANAYHQLAKLPEDAWDGFLAWLWDFEFSKLGLPAPDAVLLLDMPERVSSALVKRRSAETGQKLDIHETHGEYLRACRRAASYVASSCGWRVIPCAPEDGEEPYPREVIADRVREALADIL